MPRSLILTLRGGLGNQLFQYASARGIAARHGLHLALDVFTGFENDSYRRRYELSDFNVQAEVVGRDEAFCVRRRHALQRRVWWRVEHLSVLLRHTYKMDGLMAIRRSMCPGSDLYVNCYLQSYRYFEDIWPLLRSELTLSRDLKPGKRNVASLITGSNSVAVHIRSAHGLCSDGTVVSPRLADSRLPVDYYRTALADLASRVGTCQRVVFCDTPKCPSGFMEALGSGAVVIPGEDANACDDLVLMSLCRHHIIANSTYGWWGAWLGTHPEGFTYAPRHWFLARKPVEFKDFYPRQWIIL